MAKDRQWVVLDQSQNATKGRDAADDDAPEHTEGAADDGHVDTEGGAKQNQ